MMHDMTPARQPTLPLVLGMYVSIYREKEPFLPEDQSRTVQSISRRGTTETQAQTRIGKDIVPGGPSLLTRQNCRGWDAQRRKGAEYGAVRST